MKARLHGDSKEREWIAGRDVPGPGERTVEREEAWKHWKFGISSGISIICLCILDTIKFLDEAEREWTWTVSRSVKGRVRSLDSKPLLFPAEVGDRELIAGNPNVLISGPKARAHNQGAVFEPRERRVLGNGEKERDGENGRRQGMGTARLDSEKERDARRDSENGRGRKKQEAENGGEKGRAQREWATALSMCLGTSRK